MSFGCSATFPRATMPLARAHSLGRASQRQIIESKDSTKGPNVDLFSTLSFTGDPPSRSLTPSQGCCPFLCRILLSKKHYEDPIEKYHFVLLGCLFLPLRSPVMDVSVGWVTRLAHTTISSAFGPGYSPVCRAAPAVHHAPT